MKNISIFVLLFCTIVFSGFLDSCSKKEKNMLSHEKEKVTDNFNRQLVMKEIEQKDTSDKLKSLPPEDKIKIVMDEKGMGGINKNTHNNINKLKEMFPFLNFIEKTGSTEGERFKIIEAYHKETVVFWAPICESNRFSKIIAEDTMITYKNKVFIGDDFKSLLIEGIECEVAIEEYSGRLICWNKKIPAVKYLSSDEKNFLDGDKINENTVKGLSISNIILELNNCEYIWVDSGV